MREFLERRCNLIIAVFVVASSLPYIARLGFYNDDWALLSGYRNAVPGNPWALMRSDGELMRPARVAYSAFLYMLFGVAPLGYHVTNILVIAGAATMFWALLRKMGMPARDAFAVSILWPMLPHAATWRFWYATFQGPASVALALASVLAEIRFVDEPRWRWRVLAVLLLLACGLMYETPLPLLLLAPFLAAGYARLQGKKTSPSDRRWFLIYPGAVALMIPAKLLTTTRLERLSGNGYTGWLMSYLKTAVAWPDSSTLWGFNIWKAMRIAFLDLGVSLPRHAVESARHLGLGVESITALALAGLVFACLRVQPSDDSPSEHLKHAVVYVGAGLVAFLLGWSVFLGTAQLQLTTTGSGTRVAGAASLGVAFIVVGLIRAAEGMTPRWFKPNVMALLTASVVACGCFVIYRLADDWGTAWTRQQQVLAQIANRFPDGFSGKTLLLDGVCQYEGPASVFEASWDLQSALQAVFRDSALRGELVTADLEVRPHDLRTTQYGEERLYPYGSVIAFRPESDVMASLDDREQAERFFAAWDPDRSGGCPLGRIGNGVDVFGTGQDIVYGEGFYPLENNARGESWRWMAGVGIIHAPNARRDTVLTIAGRLPAAAPSSVITIRLNGRVLDRIEGATVLRQRYLLSASALGDDESCELRISASRTFVPAESELGSADGRRLGFVLDELGWRAVVMPVPFLAVIRSLVP